MSPESFCTLALQENLGGYGKNKFEEIEMAEELMDIALKKAGKSVMQKSGPTGNIFGAILGKIN